MGDGNVGDCTRVALGTWSSSLGGILPHTWIRRRGGIRGSICRMGLGCPVIYRLCTDSRVGGGEDVKFLQDFGEHRFHGGHTSFNGKGRSQVIRIS